MGQYKIATKKEIPLLTLNRFLKKYDGFVQATDQQRFINKDVLERYAEIIKYFDDHPDDVLYSESLMRMFKVSNRTANRDMNYLGNTGKLFYKTSRSAKGVLKGYLGKNKKMVNLLIKLQPENDNK